MATASSKQQAQPPEEQALRTLEAIAFANLGDYIELAPDGQCRLRQEALADPQKMLAVEYVEQAEHGFKIKLGDKVAALEALLALEVAAGERLKQSATPQ